MRPQSVDDILSSLWITNRQQAHQSTQKHHRQVRIRCCCACNGRLCHDSVTMNYDMLHIQQRRLRPLLFTSHRSSQKRVRISSSTGEALLSCPAKPVIQNSKAPETLAISGAERLAHSRRRSLVCRQCDLCSAEPSKALPSRANRG